MENIAQEILIRLEEKIDNFIEKQSVINELVIRHDEKIKGIWKIPIVSGAIMALLIGLGVFISQIL